MSTRPYHITGFSLSVLIHAGLALLLMPLLFAADQKPPEPEKPIELPLELVMFEPKAPEPDSVPTPEVAPQPPPPIAKPLVKPKPEPKPEPKKPEKKPEPKQAKPVEKKIEPKKVLEKRVEPPVKLPPKPVEKALPKPDRALIERRLAQQREAELQRQQAHAMQQQALQAQRQQQQAEAAEQVARQQRAAAAQRAVAQAELQRQHQAQAAADARRLAQQRAQQEASARAAQQAANATPVMSSPRFRQRPRQPDYPRAAMEAGVEGTAIVRVTLSSGGSITAISLHRSTGHAALDAAAVKAVRGWSFMPAVRNGQAIASIVQVPVNFRLND